MRHNAFFKLAREGAPRGAYLLCGQEEYAKERALETLTGRVEPAARDLNVQVFLKPAERELLSAAETLPFFADFRLLIVRECGAFQSSGEQIKAFAKALETLPETTCLVFFERGMPPKKTLYHELEKADRIALFEPLSAEEAERWAVQNARRRGAALPPQVARQLVAMCGVELANLSNELNKVIAHAAEGEITPATLDASVRRSVEYSVFVLLEKFLQRKSGEGFTILYGLMREGEQPALLMSFLAGRLRLMREGRLLLDEGKPMGAAVKQLGGNAYAARKALEAAQKLSLPFLDAALVTLAEADYAVKSGARRDRAALEAALMQIFCVNSFVN